MLRWKDRANGVAQDSRYALRWFRRELILTGGIVATLAFGIGLNAGVFSVLSGMVFRSRVETDAASFFQVLVSPPSPPNAPAHLFSSSIAEFKAYRTAPAIASLAAWTVSSGRMDDDADPSLLMLVSREFFQVYGLERAKYGRLFQPVECEAPAAAPVVLLSEQLWRDRFHGDPRILGRQVQIYHTAFQVVGVLPAAFAGRLRGPGIWIPYSMHAAFFGGVDLFRESSRRWLTVEGRLRSGHSQAEALRELNALMPGMGRTTLVLTNGSIFQDPSSRMIAVAFAVLLTGALALILLLACTNVTLLLLSRAVARRYEMSVRMAMGASRGRLIRMAATEGILLSLLSGGLSAGIAGAVPATLLKLVPRMPHYPIHADWIVFTYMAGITITAGFCAAMVPAMESLRSNLSGSLRHEDSAFTVRQRRFRLRDLLVTGQVTMSLVLVVGASLFARTQYRLFVADSGLDVRQVLMATLVKGVGSAGRPEIEASLRAIPGVRSVSFATSVFWARSEENTLRLAGGRTGDAAISAVTPNFFHTLGIPMIRGRSLDPSAPRRVVITAAAAERLWPGKDAVAQTFETPDGSQWEVAGVARESELDRRSTVPRIFRVVGADGTGTTVLLRYDGDPTQLSRTISSTLDSIGIDLRESPRTLEADIAEMGSRFRVSTGFAVFFGGSAFFLAITGVYGVMSFAIKRRTKEMGIRLALGATRADIVRQVLHSGLRSVVWGLLSGLPLAYLSALCLQRAFRNTPTPFSTDDPIAFGAVPAAMLLCAVVALLKPALYACSVNPAASLRQD